MLIIGGFEKSNSSLGERSASISMTGYVNSGSNYSKPDGRSEEGEKMIVYALNELSSQISDTLDKEKKWRTGKINLEYDDLGNNNKNQESFELAGIGWHESDVTEWLTPTDNKILKQNDAGRAMIEVKNQFNSVRGLMEDLITDVEALSKTINRGNTDFVRNNVAIFSIDSLLIERKRCS